MDETSDISRIEQVTICLKYVLAGETLETLSDFFRQYQQTKLI
jgi:hypothetical protein